MPWSRLFLYLIFLTFLGLAIFGVYSSIQIHLKLQEVERLEEKAKQDSNLKIWIGHGKLWYYNL